MKCFKHGKIGGLGIDVYEYESGYFMNDMSNSYTRDTDLSIILSMPNVIVTSHQGFFTKEALEGIVTTTLENIYEFFENNNVVNEVK